MALVQSRELRYQWWNDLASIALGLRLAIIKGERSYPVVFGAAKFLDVMMQDGTVRRESENTIQNFTSRDPAMLGMIQRAGVANNLP